MLLIIGLRILSLVQLPYYLLVPSEIVKRIQKVACVSFMLFLGPTPRGGLLFFHVTAACSFLSISPVAVVDMYVAYPRFCSSRVGGVGCSNVLITLRLLAKRVHVTCCRCWHVALSLMLNRGGGGGLITFLTALRLLATRVHVTCCRCCQSWAKSSKRRTAAEETQSRQQGRRNYESFEGRCWYVARFVFLNVDLIVAIPIIIVK